jgi:uncharacterized cupin superfamily protein
MKPVLNIDEVALEKHGHGDRFAAATGSLSLPIGAKAIGARLVKVPPGKRAWPYHCHYGNEEMFIIQSGTGTYRYGGEEYPVRPGDVLAAPAGGHETARQLVNGGKDELVYIALSTMFPVDVVEYPDSGKFACAAGDPRSDNPYKSRFRHIGKPEDAHDYWEGED